MARVLVIDDEHMIRWSIERTLTAAGHDVTVGGTAAEGIELFKRLRPDVVFLDLRLPDADGVTVLKSMKDEKSPAAVIVMTAFEEDCPVDEAKRLGAFEYLKKPFDFYQLDVILRRALQVVPSRHVVGAGGVPHSPNNFGNGSTKRG